jgi:hypothetical protein
MKKIIYVAFFLAPSFCMAQNGTSTTITITNAADAGLASPPPSQGGCSSPMLPTDYESAKTNIAQNDFEDTKLALAKQIAGTTCLTAEQIRGFMELLTSENNKLDLAKFAYPQCYDKNNYSKVNDAFQSNNSSKELSNYISKQQ